MSVSKIYRVYGYRGRECTLARDKSQIHDYSMEGNTRIIEFKNGDKLGRYDYCEVEITRDSAELCRIEIIDQYIKGAFSSGRNGKIVEIMADGTEKLIEIPYEKAIEATDDITITENIAVKTKGRIPYLIYFGKKDEDIFKYLMSKKDKQKYLRNLIRQDMNLKK